MLDQLGTLDLEWHWGGRSHLGQLCGSWQTQGHCLLPYGQNQQQYRIRNTMRVPTFTSSLLWLSQSIRVTITEYHTGWLMNSRNLLLTVVEMEKSKVIMPAWLGSGEARFWVAGGWLLAVSTRGGRGYRALWGLSYESTNLIHDGPPSWPKSLPDAPPPNTITQA